MKDIFQLKIFLFVLIISGIFFNISSVFGQVKNDRNTFVLETDNLQTIPRDYLLFLEGVSKDISFDELKNADWKNTMKTPQSFYEGYWIKVSIFNKSDAFEMGIHHNWNFEKKIIFNNSLGITIFPFLDYHNPDYKYRNENRIWFDYKIEMPTNEVTEVYSFFRSRPLDRMNAKENGLDRIAIGSWEEVEYTEFFRIGQYFISIPVFFFFGMYFLLFFVVSKDKNYLWISILFISFLYQGIGFSLSSFYGIRFNYLYGPMGFSALSMVIIQFFRNLLNLSSNFPRIDKIFVWSIRISFVCMCVYFYDSFDYPDGEIYKNMIKHPYPLLGLGTVPIYLSFIPVISAGITSIGISFLLWRKGDQASGYLFLAFLIPLFVILFYAGSTLLPIFEQNFRFALLIKAISTFLFLFMPVTVGLALAQRLNDFKKEAMDKLETKVQQRTLELSEANQLITESINSASIIQNAILPKIDRKIYGFHDFEFIWEPRDIVGGDFYWLDKKGDWTCFVLADCTGHGIPGAFMTLISSTLLDRVSSIEDLSQPDIILNQLDEFLEETLKLKDNKNTDFGLDGGVCSFSKKHQILRYAGAKLSLYQKLNGELKEFKGDKKSIGYEEKEHPVIFKNHEIKLNEKSNFFLFSDGVTDQVGGERKIMYGKKRIIKQIEGNSDVSQTINSILRDVQIYQHDEKRRDDLSLFGFSIA